MIFFRSCPRCSGDRSLEHDHYGSYVLCLACGFVTYPEEPKSARKIMLQSTDGPLQRSAQAGGAIGA